jgi:hypothetical protein
VTGRKPPKPVFELVNALRAVLRNAHDSGALKTPPKRIQELVRSVDYVPKDVPIRDAWAIVGGVKDFKRRRRADCLERGDGGWIHFTLTVQVPTKGAIEPTSEEVLAYDFELVLASPPEGAPGTDAHFVRIDKNFAGHVNDVERGVRCHLHPSDDDLQLPWVDLGPVETLRLLVGLRRIKER